MLIKFKKSYRVALCGKVVGEYSAGDEAHAPDDMAERLIKAGIAEASKPKVGPEETKSETPQESEESEESEEESETSEEEESEDEEG